MNDLRRRLLDVLAPCLETVVERQARLGMALSHASPLLNTIHWEGDARSFITRAAADLHRAGELIPLLESVRDLAGSDVQSQIDALIADLRNALPDALVPVPTPAIAQIAGPTEPIFLAYSRADRERAMQVYAALQAADFTLWRDVYATLASAAHRWSEIRAAIDASSSMVLCLSLHALHSTLISDAWNYAHSAGKRVIPVIVDDVFDHPDVLSGKVFVPNWMRNANWAEVDLRSEVPESARADGWRNLVHTLRTPFTPKPVPIPARAWQLPHNFVPRPREYVPLARALAAGTPSKAAALTTVLSGPAGSGKTTLAKALCRDWRVSGAFPDGIFWLTLGERLLTLPPRKCDDELLGRLLKLIEDIVGGPPPVRDVPVRDVTAAHQALARAVAGRHLLLVIDDAWSEAHVSPFLVPGPHHANLITTRFDECIPQTSERSVIYQPIDHMDRADAVRLLAFGVRDWKTERAWFSETAKRLGRQAQLVGIVNGRLNAELERANTLRGASRSALRDALDVVTERLNDHGVTGLTVATEATVFDAADPEQRDEAFRRTLELGIEGLKPEDQRRYLELGIFPDGVPVPLAILAHTWWLSYIATEHLSRQLARYALVQEDDWTLTLHGMALKSLRERLGEPARSHGWLLDTTRPAEGWHALPPDEPYLWDQLAYHLIEAGRQDELRAVLLNYSYLQAKLNARHVNALLADFDAYLGLDEDKAKDRAVRLVRHAIDMSAPVLLVAKGAFECILYGRLYRHNDLPEIAALREQAQPHVLIPLQGQTHAQAGGYLLRILVGHTGCVDGALELHDGRLVSWSEDQTLRLWTADGTPLASLEGGMERIVGVRELEDGRLLAWSEDQTLRLWTADGAPLVSVAGDTEGLRGALGRRDDELLAWLEDTAFRLWGADGTSFGPLLEETSRGKGALELRDGRLVTWSGDDMRLWGADGTPLDPLPPEGYGHTEAVRGLIELEDGRLVSWGWDTMRLWSADGTLLGSLEGHTDSLMGVLKLRDGRLVSWADDHTLRLWTPDAKPLISLEGHTSSVKGALELRDRRLLSWSDDYTLRLWAPDGSPLVCLEGHTHWPKGALELHDGRLVSWADDHTLRVWDVDGSPLACLEGHTGGVTGALELRDGRLVSWAEDHTLRLWAADGSPLALLAGPRDIDADGISGVFELGDGRLVSWAEDQALRLWDVDGSALDVTNLDSAPASLRAWLIEHHADWPTFAVQRYTVGRRSQRLLWKHGEALHVHDAQTGELQAGFYTDSAITAVGFLQDETLICLGCENGQVLFLNVMP